VEAGGGTTTRSTTAASTELARERNEKRNPLQRE
jgi:hypothetical protein